MVALSHEVERGRLAVAVPGAVDRAVVIGDPRWDRMLASVAHRPRFRAALGVGEHQDLVVVSSTWRAESLFGSWPDLLRQLLAELPVDRYRVAAVLHPHLWFAHGPHQVRLWLADCLRSGLVLIPPAEGWAAALIAADVVVGDHGAVTCYGAALDKPVVLASFPAEEVAVGSAADRLGSLAPVLHRRASLRTQLESAQAGFAPGRFDPVAELVTSAPARRSPG
ncbi:hypothetical protein [Actinokineospora diospyrosa]|uniref:CDP-glycerol:poly(Glycerophosphate) glycerophosphotransferase n=1 Tax=Actinokineospora diospyrosa TaxID=103728 RepID=A0ABT1IBP8_9PSEU|nr:hypothetical protein [Actinokineospora diospyrosa]MCP2270056.1 hypothetical protein [Actinokineospora diospyrosa]